MSVLWKVLGCCVHTGCSHILCSKCVCECVYMCVYECAVEGAGVLRALRVLPHPVQQVCVCTCVCTCVCMSVLWKVLGCCVHTGCSQILCSRCV